MPYQIHHLNADGTANHIEGNFRTLKDLAEQVTPWAKNALHVKVNRAGEIVETYDVEFLQNLCEKARNEYDADREANYEKVFYNTGVCNLPQNRKFYWRKK